MTVAIQKVIEYQPITCGECGCQFAIGFTYYRERKENGGNFHCPNGHVRVFRESDVQRLTRELAQKDQQLARQKERVAAAESERDREARRVIAQKAVVTRLKNKAARGECPCCHKLFPDLAGHMAGEHPGYEGRPEPEETPNPEGAT